MSVRQQTLNDTLLVLERNIFFFSEWVPYFVSLQNDYMLMFKSRERWEQGLKPDKVRTALSSSTTHARGHSRTPLVQVIELHEMLLLGEMKVDVGASDASHFDSTSRLFRRKLLETDELDEVRTAWLDLCGSGPLSHTHTLYDTRH